MDYSAIGQTTHLAARMEQLATPGSILLMSETLRLAEGVVEVKPLGPIPIKGLGHPLEAFELVGARSPWTRLQAFAARTLTPFVGRQVEFEAMRQAHELAGAGHGQLMGVMGEPGVGKTRLFYEFLCAPCTQGWLLLESQAASHGKAIPYHPIRELFKAYFQIEAQDGEVRVCEKVTGKLRRLDPALEPTLPAVLALLDVPVDDRAWQALDPPQRRQRTLDALKRLLLRESQVQPLLLVCENLHWIDTETQAFLDSLVDSLPTARILLLVNYRPEYQHSWGSKTCYTQLRIGPLVPASAVGLLQALLGDDPTLESLQRVLIERTEGNPFFLEESVRTLEESQVVVGEPGAYHLARAPGPMQVPATVQAVLAARIDRLPAEEKTLLQTAAVIGRDVPFALLQAIIELPEEVLRGALTHLRAAEFLYEASLFPEIEYTFKHALTQEVAYGGLLRERRRALHAGIVEAIERLSPGRLAEQVERLAHHALQGEVWEKALCYYRQAGAKAAARSAHREARGCFEHALVALQHLPEQQATWEQAIDLRFHLRNALLPLGEQGQVLDHLREAATLAHVLDDRQRLVRVFVYMAECFREMNNLDQAVESGQRALALATTLGDVGLQVMANFYVGSLCYNLGNFPRAMDCLGWNVVSLEGDRLRERFGMTGLPSVLSRCYLSWSLAELGAFAEAIARGEEGVGIAEAADQPFSRIWAYAGIGKLYLDKGDVHRAIPVLERCVGLCQVWDIPNMFPTVASRLGSAYALCGRVTEAQPLLEQVTSNGRGASHALYVAHLSEAYLLAGRTEDGLERAQHALALSRDQQQRGYEACALRLLGTAVMHRDPPDGALAEAYFREALTLAEELGMRPLQAHCHLGLGVLYGKIGRPEPARVELSAAIALYRAMVLLRGARRVTDRTGAGRTTPRSGSERTRLGAAPGCPPGVRTELDFLGGVIPGPYPPGAGDDPL